MISVKVARKLRAQIRELRERKDVRAAALAVQKFVTTYDEAPTVTPYAGDFRIGSQGRVSLREAKRRGESEREALRAEATRLHRILDRALLKMAERGRKALGRPGVRTVEVEGYGRSREALKRIYPGGSPYPLHLAAGAKVSGIADAQLEAAALLMAEVIETMSERHDQDMTEGRKEIDDPAPGMDGGDDADESMPDSSAEPMDGEAKLHKSDVNYKYASDPKRSCGECRFFVEPAACRIVGGLIRPVDVCDRFEPSDGQKAADAFTREYRR